MISTMCLTRMNLTEEKRVAHHPPIISKNSCLNLELSIWGIAATSSLGLKANGVMLPSKEDLTEGLPTFLGD